MSSSIEKPIRRRRKVRNLGNNHRLNAGPPNRPIKVRYVKQSGTPGKWAGYFKR